MITADVTDTGREAGGGVREGKEWGYGESRLTRIFLFVISLAACTSGKARTSELRAVVVWATHGVAQGT